MAKGDTLETQITDAVLNLQTGLSQGVMDKLNIRAKLIKKRRSGVFNSLKAGIRPGLRNP